CRRLRQDVAAFWKFARDQASRLAQKYPVLAGLTAERFASLLVGRWPSGAPVMREPDHDNPQLARHPVAVNDFNFANATDPVPLLPGASPTPDNFPAAPPDPGASRCPFAAHIRKINPRDDGTEAGDGDRILPKRILRRGIPFGRPL